MRRTNLREHGLRGGGARRQARTVLVIRAVLELLRAAASGCLKDASWVYGEEDAGLGQSFVFAEVVETRGSYWRAVLRLRD